MTSTHSASMPRINGGVCVVLYNRVVVTTDDSRRDYFTRQRVCVPVGRSALSVRSRRNTDTRLSLSPSATRDRSPINLRVATRLPVGRPLYLGLNLPVRYVSDKRASKQQECGANRWLMKYNRHLCVEQRLSFKLKTYYTSLSR